MAIIEDHFTGEGSDTLLDSHTPDTAGTGWTNIDGTSTMSVDVPADNLRPAGASARGTLYSAQGTYPSNEYDVELTFSGDGGLDDPFWLVGRLTDADNYYAGGLYDYSLTDCYLFKKVADVVTTLDSADTDWAPTATLKFEIRDAAKKVFVDDVEKLSDPDNALTSTGEAGVGAGNLRAPGDDVNNGWIADDFLVTAAAVGAPPIINLVMAPYIPAKR